MPLFQMVKPINFNSLAERAALLFYLLVGRITEKWQRVLSIVEYALDQKAEQREKRFGYHH